MIIALPVYKTSVVVRLYDKIFILYYVGSPLKPDYVALHRDFLPDGNVQNLYCCVAELHGMEVLEKERSIPHK